MSSLGDINDHNGPVIDYDHKWHFNMAIEAHQGCCHGPIHKEGVPSVSGDLTEAHEDAMVRAAEQAVRNAFQAARNSKKVLDILWGYHGCKHGR